MIRCLLIWAVATSIVGCGSSSPYEVDFTFEILKKSPDGTSVTFSKVEVEKAGTGEGGASDIPGVGRSKTIVRQATARSTKIAVTVLGDEVVIFSLHPGGMGYMFYDGQDYGWRVTVKDIRKRQSQPKKK